MTLRNLKRHHGKENDRCAAFFAFLPAFCKVSVLFSYLYAVISILIPTYNFCPGALVAALAAQAETLARKTADDFACEILVADDASTDRDTLRRLHGLSRISGCRLIFLQANTGRAAIRNRLAREAHGEFLLFIDADAEVTDSLFLEKMWAERLRADVVCGRVGLPPRPASPGRELRYAYELSAESRRPAAVRARRPYAHFSTFCVMMRRRAWQAVGFDERCTEYGYEDVLMGLELQARGVSILHTDHTLVHCGIDTNAEFLRKTDAAARTAARLSSDMPDISRASRLCSRLGRLYLVGPLRRLLLPAMPLLRRQLLGRHPRLVLFKLYQLGAYLRALKTPVAHTRAKSASAAR